MKTRLDIGAMTVFHVDGFGREHDLNAHGEKCRTIGDLAELVAELDSEGLFSASPEDGWEFCDEAFSMLYELEPGLVDG